jgi:hypothetical protein
MRRALGPPPARGRILEVSPRRGATADRRRADWLTWLGIAAFLLAYVAWVVLYVTLVMPAIDDWARHAIGFGFGKLHVLPLVGLPVIAIAPLGWLRSVRLARRVRG